MDDKLKNLLDADILHVVGLSNASPKTKESALSAAKNQILGAVVKRVYVQLPPDLQIEFERLFGTEDETLTEEDVAFLKKHVPDLDALVFEETLAFKQGVMDTVAEMRKKSADESQKINGILKELKE